MTQADRIKKAVGEFGAAAKSKLNEGGQPEDQLRNPIEQLFAVLAAECGHAKGALTLIGEKSLAELHTRPDFAVQLNKALIGFIEVKAPGKGADPRKFKDNHAIGVREWDRSFEREIRAGFDQGDIHIDGSGIGDDPFDAGYGVIAFAGRATARLVIDDPVADEQRGAGEILARELVSFSRAIIVPGILPVEKHASHHRKLPDRILSGSLAGWREDAMAGKDGPSTSLSTNEGRSPLSPPSLAQRRGLFGPCPSPPPHPLMPAPFDSASPTAPPSSPIAPAIPRRGSRIRSRSRGGTPSRGRAFPIAIARNGV